MSGGSRRDNGNNEVRQAVSFIRQQQRKAQGKTDCEAADCENKLQ